MAQFLSPVTQQDTFHILSSSRNAEREPAARLNWSADALRGYTGGFCVAVCEDELSGVNIS